MKLILCVLFLSATAYGLAEEDVADESARIAIKLYNDCSNDIGFSVCLKKKAITLLDRLGRMENVSVATGINIVRKPTASYNQSALTETELEQNLPRAIDAKEDALSVMFVDKLFNYIGSRNLEVSLPKFEVEELVEEARKGDIGSFNLGGGGGKKGGKKGGKNKKGGMMNMLMMMMGTKLAALMGLKTIMTFFIAKKALIIGKIALILSGMMFFRKFMSGMNGKNAGGFGSLTQGSTGWDTSSYGSSNGGALAGSYGGSGSHGGWQSGGWNAGGGYDKRSFDGHDLAYRGHSESQK